MVDILGEKKICKKCGKCCKLIASTKSYDELCKEAESEDKVAMNFLKLFLPYSSLEEARKIDVNVVDANIALNKKIYGEDAQTYFYYCRYLGEDNSCNVYDMRPKMCRFYPKNEFVVLPEDCAYEGYSFVAREKVKARIRKAKEELLDIKVLRHGEQQRGIIEKLNRHEKKLLDMIQEYKNFGSQDW